MRLLTRREDGNLYLIDNLAEVCSMFIVNPFTNYEVTSALRLTVPSSNEELVIIPIYEDICASIMHNLLGRGFCDASDKCVCMGIDAVTEMKNGVEVGFGDKEEATRRIDYYRAEYAWIDSLLKDSVV